MAETLADKLVEISLITVILAGVTFLAVQIIGIGSLSVMAVVLISSIILCRRKWHVLRQKGLINLCSPRMRAVLLERSILDIVRDMLYFPYLTKIIGVFLRLAASKPHPSQVSNLINQLPKQVSEAVNAKGILSLAPSAVEGIILPIDNRDMLPKDYGVIDERWDHDQVYERSAEQVHEETIEHRLVHFLDGKLGWPTAMGLVALTAMGAAKMNPTRFKKMMIQNVTFICMLFAAVAVLIKMKKIIRNTRTRKLPVMAVEEERKEE